MDSREPLYQQVYWDLRKKIEAGVYPEGFQVPTEAELEKLYNVSRITIKRALGQLAQEGCIERIPGRGSFVLPRERWSAQGRAENARPKPLLGFVAQGIGASYGMRLLIGVESAAAEAGLSLLLRLTGGDRDKEEAAIKEMVARGCLGLVLFPVNGEVYSPSLLQAYLSGLPVVLVDRYFPGLEIPSVSSDNRAGARLATDHLLDLGHREILLLSPRPYNTISIEDRVKGYVDAFTARGLAIDHNLILDDLTTYLPGKDQSVSYEKDVERIAQVLSQRPGVTAAFALEYGLAVAAHTAAAWAGRKVPDEFSIICFDHPPCTLPTQPFFTHLKQDEERLGRIAVETVLELAQGGTGQGAGNGPGRIQLPVELRLGFSTAKAPQHAGAG